MTCIKEIIAIIVLGCFYRLESSEPKAVVPDSAIDRQIDDEEYGILGKSWSAMNSDQRIRILQSISDVTNRNERCIRFIALSLCINKTQAVSFLSKILDTKKHDMRIVEPFTKKFTRIDRLLCWEILKIVSAHSINQIRVDQMDSSLLMQRLKNFDVSPLVKRINLPDQPPLAPGINIFSQPPALKTKQYADQKIAAHIEHYREKRDMSSLLLYLNHRYGTDYRSASQQIISTVNTTKKAKNIYDGFINKLIDHYSVKSTDKEQIKAIEINLYSILRTICQAYDHHSPTATPPQVSPIQLFVKKYPHFIRDHFPHKPEDLHPKKLFIHKHIHRIKEDNITDGALKRGTIPSSGSIREHKRREVLKSGRTK